MVFELQAELSDSPFVVSSLGMALWLCLLRAAPTQQALVLKRTTADNSSYASCPMCTYERGFTM